MRKKLFVALVCGLMIVPFIMGTATAKTLKIGSMSPLTGPYASDGTDIKNGVLTAIQVFEEAGGIPGYDKIELFAQDTACDPKQAVAAANKLINLEVAGVVGAYCSSSTIPASETLDEEDIPMLTPASTNEKVTDRGLPYMFRLCGRDDDQAPAAAKFLKESLNAKTIFIVDDKTTYSQGLADGVSKAAKELGMEVVEHDHVNQGDKDFAAVLTNAKQGQRRRFLHVPAGIFPRRTDGTAGQTHRHDVPDCDPGRHVPAQVHGSGQGCRRRRLPDLRLYRQDHPGIQGLREDLRAQVRAHRRLCHLRL
jgi:branched-chain amino acid transport system substrate-binding protein